MSRDAHYIIQLEGPFGDGEKERVIEKLKPYEFAEWDYDTIQGWTKWARDEEVIEAAKLSSPIQILRKHDDSFWEEIWRCKAVPLNGLT